MTWIFALLCFNLNTTLNKITRAERFEQYEVEIKSTSEAHFFLRDSCHVSNADTFVTSLLLALFIGKMIFWENVLKQKLQIN